MSKQKEFQELVNLLCDENSMKYIELELKNVHAGNARTKTRKISIPLWVTTQSVEYQWAYVIHEFCHFFTHDKFRELNHGKRFKATEQINLYNYGLVPIYAKAYTKELQYINGRSCWVVDNLRSNRENIVKILKRR